MIQISEKTIVQIFGKTLEKNFPNYVYISKYLLEYQHKKYFSTIINWAYI
jgi:hypothetical protein